MKGGPDGYGATADLRESEIEFTDGGLERARFETVGVAGRWFERSKHIAALRSISAMRGSPLAEAVLKKGLDGVIGEIILGSFGHG